MTWIIANWKMVLLGLVVAASFGAGWTVKGALETQKAQSIKEAQDKLIDELRENEAHIANILERKLKELRANETIIKKEVIRVIDRPVYSNECLDTDGLQLIERARAGKTDSSKPAGKVSGAK